MSVTPTIGRIVHYMLSGLDADQINKRRRDASQSGISAQNSGAQVHVGNSVSAGDVYPLVITRVWPGSSNGSVNGQVLLDGNDLFWATSVSEGTGQRQYQWPTRG